MISFASGIPPRRYWLRKEKLSNSSRQAIILVVSVRANLVSEPCQRSRPIRHRDFYSRDPVLSGQDSSRRLLEPLFAGVCLTLYLLHFTTVT